MPDVTIDSDPGGYVGAKAEDFVKVFERDRQIIDRVGVYPKKQSVMPWVWMGWGTVWWGEGSCRDFAACPRAGSVQGGDEGRLGTDARPQRRRVRMRASQHGDGGKGRLDDIFHADPL